jgi:hypothetical protein
LTPVPICDWLLFSWEWQILLRLGSLCTIRKYLWMKW